MSEVKVVNGVEVCPDCDSAVTGSNPLVGERDSVYGSCVECYDPTPTGVEYSDGFEMNH
jgi:hypothetical protein